MKKISKAKVERLVKNIYTFLSYLDGEVKHPVSRNRGERMAHMANLMEVNADIFSRYELGYGAKKLANIKNRYKL